MALLARAAAGHVSRDAHETRCRTMDGRDLWTSVTATVLHDHDGNLMCILAMFEDITERKQTERTLRRAERLAAIGTLAAGIAHEINNPLGAITLSVDAVVMSEDRPNREENIRASALRCGRIVKSMLQFARDDVSRRSSGDLGDVARRARDMVRSFAARRQVPLRLEIDEAVPEIVMNATEMARSSSTCFPTPSRRPSRVTGSPSASRPRRKKFELLSTTVAPA
jgi:signal transduction histidine kinase